MVQTLSETTCPTWNREWSDWMIWHHEGASIGPRFKLEALERNCQLFPEGGWRVVVLKEYIYAPNHHFNEQLS